MLEIKNILKTEDARINFLKGLMRLAKCDGVKTDEEIQFYLQAAVALDLKASQIDLLSQTWSNDNEKIEIFFDTSKEKMFFFIQAIQLCWIDNKYEEVEQKEIQKIAEELGISMDAIEKVEDWVREGIAWNQRGDQLIDLQ